MSEYSIKLVYTILISGVVIIKKGKIVEARLQEILMLPTVKCSSWIIQVNFKKSKRYKLHLQVRLSSWIYKLDLKAQRFGQEDFLSKPFILKISLW